MDSLLRQAIIDMVATMLLDIHYPRSLVGSHAHAYEIAELVAEQIEDRLSALQATAEGRE